MTTAVSNLTEHLSALVGSDFVFVNDGTYRVLPANTEEVAAVVGFADRHGLRVQPTGGGTKLAWRGASKPEIELSLARLNQVLEHSWQDLVCRVQAGCTWDAMQQELARYGQFVALDPVFAQQATVGGVLATNDSGAIRHRYGSLRDLVIGMTIVLADGTIAHSGGKVVKNVAGYDLPKLLTGSWGSLAIITEANFRLYPLPQHPESFTIVADSAQKLAPLMQAIRHSHLLTQALQLRADASGFRLDIQLNVHPEARQNEVLAQMVQSHGLPVQTALPEVWQAREALLLRENAIAFKATMLPDRVAHFARTALAYGADTVTQSLGVMFGSLLSIGDVTFADLKRELEAAGGTVTLCTPTPGLTSTALEPGLQALTQAVKKQFDPNNTLGGI